MHGEFLQSPVAHAGGSGCSKCSQNISKLELEFLQYLNIKTRQLYVKPYKIDGYDSETNTIYEFLGDYWHGNPERFDPSDVNKKTNVKFQELYNTTFKKFEFLKSKGYNIKYIWETDWLKFKKDNASTLKILEYNNTHINIT